MSRPLMGVDVDVEVLPYIDFVSQKNLGMMDRRKGRQTLD